MEKQSIRNIKISDIDEGSVVYSLITQHVAKKMFHLQHPNKHTRNSDTYSDVDIITMLTIGDYVRQSDDITNLFTGFIILDTIDNNISTIFKQSQGIS